MIRNIQRLGHVWWRLLSLPATMAHELTHMLLAVPWAEESAIIVDDVGVVHAVNWTDDAPRWGIILSSLGPTFLGALVGFVGLWQLLTSTPSGPNDWLIAGALAAWWVIYATPSGDDLDIYTGNTDS